MNPIRPLLPKSLSIDACLADCLCLFVRTGPPIVAKCSAGITLRKIKEYYSWKIFVPYFLQMLIKVLIFALLIPKII